MKRYPFPALISLVLGLSALIFRAQQKSLQEINVDLAQNNVLQKHDRFPVSSEPQKLAATSPPVELLRLRNEVGTLRQKLETPLPREFSKSQAETDWAFVHGGNKPSQQPGYRSFQAAANVGFDTPEAAFQSFHFAMRNQSQEPLNQSRMKQLYDVPDDFDQPGVNYSIDLGQGIGGEIGYRIVEQKQVSPKDVRLSVDYETRGGGSFRRETILIEKNGQWRIRLAGIRRVTMNPP